MRRFSTQALAAVVVGVVALGACGARPARAHGGGDGRVRAVLDQPLPAALAGMRIEAHRTVAPQLVVDNPTSRVLEVLDERGAAFVRIGANGVEANVSSRAWFQTLGPGATVPVELRDETHEPRWVRVSAARSFGWFEPRLDPGAIEEPHTSHDVARSVEVARWSVPLRVDGESVRLTGTFRRDPPPAGAYQPRLTSSREIARGVRVRLLPGGTPGLLVENAGPDVLTVLDADGAPFLRIGPGGVEANVRSRAWPASGRRSGALGGGGATAAGVGASGSSAADEPSWQRVASTPRYGWIEPRLSPVHAETPRVAWRIPVVLGTAPLEVSGVSEWQRVGPVEPSSIDGR